MGQLSFQKSAIPQPQTVEDQQQQLDPWTHVWKLITHIYDADPSSLLWVGLALVAALATVVIIWYWMSGRICPKEEANWKALRALEAIKLIDEGRRYLREINEQLMARIALKKELENSLLKKHLEAERKEEPTEAAEEVIQDRFSGNAKHMEGRGKTEL